MRSHLSASTNPDQPEETFHGIPENVAFIAQIDNLNRVPCIQVDHAAGVTGVCLGHTMIGVCHCGTLQVRQGVVFNYKAIGIMIVMIEYLKGSKKGH